MILLDTHTWVWWTNNDPSLSSSARKAIATDPQRAIAAISCWELAMLFQKKRLHLDRAVTDWIEISLISNAIQILPLTPSIAAAACDQALLRGHKDPSDRIILATAIDHAIPLVTKDARLQKQSEVQTIW